MGLFNRSRPELILTSLSATYEGEPVLKEDCLIERGAIGYERFGQVVELVDEHGAFTGHIPTDAQISDVYQKARASGEISGGEMVFFELRKNTAAYHNLLVEDGRDDIIWIRNAGEDY